MTITTKQCKQCGKTKTVSEFYSKRAECKECTKKRPYLKSAAHKAGRFNYRKRYQMVKKLPGSATTKQIKNLLISSDTCTYCGCSLEQEQKSIDHIVPLSKGGTNEITNLAVSCIKCNCSKKDKILERELNNG